MDVPRWLSQALLLAGHTLPGEVGRKLPAGLVVLNRLNDAGGEPHERKAIGEALAMLAHEVDLEPDVTAALVRRLMALSWDEDALSLALAQFHHAPRALKYTGKAFDTYLETLPAARLRLSGSSTTWILMDALRPAFAVRGWRAEITEGTFGSALVDLMNPPDGIDALVVLLDFDSLAPRDWRLGSAEMLSQLADIADILADALDAFSARARVPLLICTIPVPSAPTAGFMDRHHAMGVRSGVDMLNARILDAAERSNRIVVVDADQALAPLAARDQSDARLWYYGRIAYSAEATRLMAQAFAETWRLLRRGPAKVLAIDLDNTLWGGVYGDDGIERLTCGEEFPGNAFQAMQRECLRLKGQGLLLVALSKNNSDALSVFERHSGMALRPDDFTAAAINWEPKPDNIRKLADDLNLGLDSFVFIDDSPHEREAMRRLCPEVLVPEMPSDPAERPLWLRRLTATWPIRLTAEDESRAALYAVERKARDAKAGAATVEAYLSGLEQRLVLSFVDEKTVVRAAQMHQRTNQFNLTTLRLTEPDIVGLMRDEAGGIAVLGRVDDKFGDHGIVIVATVAIREDEAVIRTLLMSCRVIGREVERAFMGELLRELARRGVRCVSGEYIPTLKNAMVRDFYRSCGFEQTSAGEGTTWRFLTDANDPPVSPYVTTSWEV
jgi:FkbH-like protein